MNNKTLTIFAADPTNCTGGICPTVYKSEEGKFYVQGYVVTQEIKTQVHLAENETLVEVSPELIASIAKQMA